MSDIGGDPPCWAHLLDDDHDDASECSSGGVIAGNLPGHLLDRMAAAELVGPETITEIGRR